MSDVAALISDLIEAGVDPLLVGRVAQALSEREAVLVPDEQAERRRKADRERKRVKRELDDVCGIPQTSAESADKSDPSPNENNSNPYPELPPHSPPKGGSHTPPKATPRSELMLSLDEERADAVIDHRKKLRKPLTVRAATLLSKQFAQTPDPNAAADCMIENGWQGFKPEWMENRNGSAFPRGQPPPRPKTAADVLHLAAVEMRNRENDRAQFSDNRGSFGALGGFPRLEKRSVVDG